MAASRDAGGRVAALNDPLHPAVLRLIGAGRAPWRGERACRSACAATWRPTRQASRPCSRLGLRRLSVAPAALGRVKRRRRPRFGAAMR